MALDHAKPGEVVDVRPLGTRLRDEINATLLRAEHLQVFRVVLQSGEEFSDHTVAGEITLQCLEGSVDLTFEQEGQGGGGEEEKVQRLAAGELLYLEGGQPHALKAVEDTSVLVTIYHPR